MNILRFTRIIFQIFWIVAFAFLVVGCNHRSDQIYESKDILVFGSSPYSVSILKANGRLFTLNAAGAAPRITSIDKISKSELADLYPTSVMISELDHEPCGWIIHGYEPVQQRYRVKFSFLNFRDSIVSNYEVVIPVHPNAIKLIFKRDGNIRIWTSSGIFGYDAAGKLVSEVPGNRIGQHKIKRLAFDAKRDIVWGFSDSAVMIFDLNMKIVDSKVIQSAKSLNVAGDVSGEIVAYWNAGDLIRFRAQKIEELDTNDKLYTAVWGYFTSGASNFIWTNASNSYDGILNEREFVIVNKESESNRTR